MDLPSGSSDRMDIESVRGDTENITSSINDESQGHKLHKYARNGDTTKVKKILRPKSTNVNQRNKDGLTALHLAAKHHHLDVVKVLVDHKADVDASDKHGLRPLHFAAKYVGLHDTDEDNDRISDDVFKYLVGKNGHTNVLDNYGQTPLHIACIKGNNNACKRLLDYKKTDTQLQDKQGNTALHMAVSNQHAIIVQMLVDAGAKCDIKDGDERTVLHIACVEGNFRIVESVIVMNSNWTAEDAYGKTCLNLAVEYSHVDVVKLCLRHHEYVNKHDYWNRTPLHYAASTGNLEITKLLLERGAGIDKSDYKESTPLHKACQNNKTNVIQVLLESNADIENENYEYYTPLLTACSYGHIETVKLLLDKKADVTAMEIDDKTAIFLAAEEGYKNVLEVLLERDDAKSIINYGDSSGNTPLHIAASRGYVQIVEYLLKEGADLSLKNEKEQKAIHLSAEYGQLSVLEVLVAHKDTNVDDGDENSNTTLHIAASHGNIHIVEVLLNKNANPEAKNIDGYTPLHCAALNGWTNIARALLIEDTYIDENDKSKKTPLHLAAKSDHVEVISLLIDEEANVEARDVDGFNCIELAINAKNSAAARAIVQCDDWQDVLRNKTNEDDTVPDTPMRKLVRKLPDVAEDVLNRCVSFDDEPAQDIKNGKTVPTVTLNYEFLDDLFLLNKWNADDQHEADDAMTKSPYTSDLGTFKSNHPLMIMVEHKRENLLCHPVVRALIKHKWTSFCRFIYYFNFLIFITFLIFLTGYLIATEAPYQMLNGTVECETLAADGYKQPLFAKIGMYVIFVTVGISMLREVLQLYQARLNYLTWENMLDCVTYLTSVLFVIDFDSCQRQTGYRTIWQWNLGSVAVFLAWINLTLFVQMFPRLGIYVVMVKTVFKTFLEFFIVFMLLVIAFALAFYAILQNQPEFSSVWQSIIKTTVMMIGEMDYGSIYVEGEVFYEVLGYILFCAFMIVMSIVIVNLLIGLAVGNISEILEKSKLTRLAMQVELILDIERSMPMFFRRKYCIETETFSSENSRVVGFGSYGYREIKSLFDLHYDESTKRRNSDQENGTYLTNRMDGKQQGQDEVNENLVAMKEMIKALMSAQGIPWKEEGNENTYM